MAHSFAALMNRARTGEGLFALGEVHAAGRLRAVKRNISGQAFQVRMYIPSRELTSSCF